MIEIPVSFGELFDKIIILQIKKERMVSVEKLNNVNFELSILLEKIKRLNTNLIRNEYEELRNINLLLWETEDKLRQKEKQNMFDHEFIELSRTVYIENDKRAALKRKINEILNSKLVEEKEY